MSTYQISVSTINEVVYSSWQKIWSKYNAGEGSFDTYKTRVSGTLAVCIIPIL
ncbi:hypothetical protein J7E71_19580 [Mesobacillus foraminis]|uniref:hypothetical protein n=1 Tax=Mesobacillus foraminis TaxID=279826 RepID=UPI001BE76C42|nr:hypothetical protein [Mesobacillus foraminis]MBT2758076.1 hypothetical protein [Mesobacillus foraminis]